MVRLFSPILGHARNMVQSIDAVNQGNSTLSIEGTLEAFVNVDKKY